MPTPPFFYSDIIRNSYRKPIIKYDLDANEEVRICKNNRNRIQLVITNSQSNTIHLSPEPDIVAGEAIFRTAKRFSHVFSIFEDSAPVSSEWYAKAGNTSTTVVVLEQELQQ